MKVIIIGAGTVGFEIAKQLINEDKDVVLIEKDGNKAKHASQYLDCIVINEEGNNLDTLKKAGIADADFFITVTDSDEVNMISCALVATEFNVPYKIARVRNLGYSKAMLMGKPFLGADYIVTPEVEAAKHIVRTVEHGATSGVISFEGTDIQVRNILIGENSFFKDKSLKEIKTNLDEEFLIAIIIRDNSLLIPSGDTIVNESDRIYIVAAAASLEKIFHKAGRPKQKIKKVAIVGGGKIGSYVARYLSGKDMKITIIDKNYDNCKNLSLNFPASLVLHGDITDESLFEEENLLTYDLFISTTKNQELNMLTAIYAKTLGIKRTISLVSKANYISIASKLDLDAIISPKASSIDAILKFIRKGNIRTVYTIFDGKAEVIEFHISDTNRIAGMPIKEIPMPQHSIITGVSRGGITLIPDGMFKIKPGDNIITITKKESISKIEELFEG